MIILKLTMPKNTKKAKNKQQSFRRDMIYKDDEQEYALVKKSLGNKRFLVVLESNQQELVGRLRGNIHKRDWVNIDDLVLISTRDFQQDKVDIIHHYTPEEFKYLKRKKEVSFDKVEHQETEDYLQMDENNHEEYTELSRPTDILEGMPSYEENVDEDNENQENYDYHNDNKQKNKEMVNNIYIDDI